MAGIGAALGYMAGGALEGYGKGIIDDARALRDARLQELADQRRNDFQMQRDEREMSFRREEGRLDREMRLREGEANRAAQGRQYMTGDDGSTLMVEGDKARPVLGADGQPLKARPKSANPTDFDKKFEIGKRIFDGDERKAAEWANGSREPSRAERARLINDTFKSLEAADEFERSRETPEQRTARRAEAQRIVDDMLNESTVKPQQQDAATTSGALPAGVNAEQLLAAARAAIEKGKDPAAVEAKLREYGLSLQSSGGSGRNAAVDEPRQSRESMGGPARYKPGGEITAGMDPRVATSQYKKDWRDSIEDWRDSIEERRKRYEEQQ